MNVLLIGSGGREHALAWKIAQSPKLAQLYTLPGNPGTAEVGINLPGNPEDCAAIVKKARQIKIDLVVIGPDVPLALGLAALPLGWPLLQDYQRQRILTFLDPDADPLGAGWNIIQSKVAAGSGGLFGKGWGNSTQARLDFLPEQTTDFIFAVFAEEFGLVGVAGLLLVFAVIVARSLWIAMEAKETYARLLGGSLALTFAVYVLMNGGMVTGLLPVVGVPMPLMSYGGTSAVTLLAGFGMLMSIHSHRKLLGRPAGWA